MTLHHTLVAAALGLATTAGCGSFGHRQAAALDPAGQCFTLRFGPWSAGGEPMDRYRPLPEVVELLDSLFRRHPRGDAFWARRWPSDSARRVAVWGQVPAGDSVWIRFPSHWSDGVIVTLPSPTLAAAMTADTLRGTGRVYVDYEPFTPPRADVTAVRTRCGQAANRTRGAPVWRPSRPAA